MRVAADERVEAQLAARAPAQRGHHAGLRHGLGALAQHAAAGVGLELERREANDIAVVGEEARQRRHLVQIAVEHRRVEEHRQRQAARGFDVAQPQRIECDFARIARALLRHVDVKGHVGEARFAQLDQQFARGEDAVGEQRGAQPVRAQMANDGEQLVARAQRGLAARDLHVRARPVVRGDQLDAAQHFVERQVAQRLGAVRQIAQRAVEVAALRDFERDATDRPAPPCNLLRQPQGVPLHALAHARQARGRVAIHGQGLRAVHALGRQVRLHLTDSRRARATSPSREPSRAPCSSSPIRCRTRR